MKITVLNAPARLVRPAAELAMLAGRFCLAALFLAGALQKAFAPEVAEQMLAAHGFTPLLIWPALVLNTFGAACLILGLWLGPMAFVLALYSMATSLFHYIPDDPWQMSILVKNWAIAGGLLVLAAHEGLNPRG
ncbi:DoxX family protein [Sulfitobacter sp. JB4-11]|uniref:DoxX family protein n=1 Tax=Sulfitobacter rhodophyticola TaxID=3238304 RepID=UPI0035126F46